MEFFNKIKSWFLSIRRLTAAIFLSILGVLVVVAVYGYAIDFYKSQKNQKYEKIQDWNSDLSMIGLKASSKTKVVNNMLYFSVEIDGYPEYLNASINKQRGFLFQFVDGDNFILFEKKVPLFEFSNYVDTKGNPTGMRYQTTEFMDTSTYEKFKAFKVLWTFDVNVKKQPPAPVATNPQGDQTDHCAVGLSRAERLRRLALNGKVRETNSSSFSVGNKSVMFSYDGSVIYCN
jgi:hypothetical protein